MKIPNSILTMIAGIALTLVSLWYGQHHGLLPAAASQEAPLVDQLFDAMMVIAIGLFILVQGTLILAAFRFRRRPGDETDGPPIHGNIPLEILWTAIPAVIVLGIGVYSFDIYMAEGSGTMDPMGHGMAHHAPKPEQMVKGAGSAIAAPLPTTVLAQATEVPAASTSGLEAPSKVAAESDLIINVTGLQFAWIFSYPDSGVTSGEIHVPVGRHVKLNMNANDVIHAFWVPQFRLKQDVIPGRQTQLQFTATQVGDYPVICAELCGAYHGGMRTRILVQTPEDYKSWISSQVASQQLESAIALKSVHEMSNSEFLAPYANELGVQSAVLDQIPTMLNHQHHHTS